MRPSTKRRTTSTKTRSSRWRVPTTTPARTRSRRACLPLCHILEYVTAFHRRCAWKAQRSSLVETQITRIAKSAANARVRMLRGAIPEAAEAIADVGPPDRSRRSHPGHWQSFLDKLPTATLDPSRGAINAWNKGEESDEDCIEGPARVSRIDHARLGRNGAGRACAGQEPAYRRHHEGRRPARRCARQCAVADREHHWRRRALVGPRMGSRKRIRQTPQREAGAGAGLARDQ